MEVVMEDLIAEVADQYRESIAAGTRFGLILEAAIAEARGSSRAMIALRSNSSVVESWTRRHDHG
jgi:hypothetical protein